MTTAELSTEALLDIVTMRHCGYLAQWHESLLRECIATARYGHRN